MKKRATEIFHKEILAMLSSTTQEEFNNSLNKVAELADILDRAGDEVSADKIDNLLKEAGFWSSFFSGLAGGSGAALWDAIKNGKLKDGLSEIAKKALMGAAAGVVVEYMIKWLDGVPVIGSYLKELVGADKLRSLLEGVVGGAVAESNFANKLVDKSIDAIEGLLGFNKKHETPIQSKPQEKTQEVPGVKAIKQEQPQKQEDSDAAEFQIAAKNDNV